MRWMEVPLAPAGLARATASAKARMFSTSLPSSNETLPMPAWMMPAFSTRNSTTPPMAAFTVHTSADPRATREVAGIRITTVADVVVELARALPPALGLAVADAARRMFDVDAEQLLDRLAAQKSTFGVRRAQWALVRATPRAESPGESISRAAIEVLRLSGP